MKKMDKRKRQHPLWIGYKFFQTLKFIFIPTSLLFIYYYKTKASWTSIAWIGIILVITFQLIICIFQWKHHTYFITDTNLELCEGMFTRKKRNIPLNRIQRFEQFDTIFHRIFRLHSLHLIVESTFGKQSTIILPMVSQEEAKNIIRVFENLNPQFNDLVGVDGKKNIIYQLKKTEFFAYSVTSLFVICTFLIFNFLVQKLTHIVLLHDNINYAFYVVIRFGAMIVITFITIYLLASLLYSIVMFIRHGDYTVEIDRNNFYITKGTRTKSTYLIPINHINGIIIENTFPKRLFSYVSIKIIDQADMLDRKRNSQILFPIIHKKRAQTLLQHIHPQFAAFQTEKTHTVSTKALFLQMIQPSYSFVIVLVLINYFSPEYLLVPIVYGLALIIIRLIKTKQTKYMYTDSTVQFQSGIFHTKLFLTTWEKIDELTITQTYLEKKLNVASVVITMQGKGRRTYVALAEYIPLTHASDIYHQYVLLNKHSPQVIALEAGL